MNFSRFTEAAEKEEQKMRLAFTGHSGSYNRGCEAIVRCSIDIIRRHIPDAAFDLISAFPGTDREALPEYLGDGRIRLNAPLAPFLPRLTPAWLLDGVRRRMAPGFPSRMAFHHRQLFREAAAVLSIGGDMFSDDYWDPALPFRDLAFIRALGLKTVIWGASIGPFHDPEAEKAFAAELRKVDLITVRETHTRNYLEGLGVSENVRLVADPAFLLDPVPEEALCLRLANTGRIVGLGLSGLVQDVMGKNTACMDAFELLARSVLREEGAKILLVAHVSNPDTAGADDDACCRRLFERLDAPDRVMVAGKGWNAPQLKYAISQCDYFIGMRTHSTIAAFSSGVPVISVGSTMKVYGINDDLFGHTGFVLPLESLNPDSLMAAYGTLVERGPETAERLKAVLPEKKIAADAAGRHLAALLADGTG
jgi:colanic acid/amylovoran biosynthesis protein